MEMPLEVKKLNPGDEYIFEFIDENGFQEISPWGIEIPPLRCYCVNADKGKGKSLRWDYSHFGDFIYESCGRGGQSTDKFDKWIYEKTGIKGYVLKYLLSDEEKYKELRQRRIEYNRQAVEFAQDLSNLDKRNDPLEVKISELINKSRHAVLSRLDPEFREKLDQNVTGNIAQIIMPKKEEDDAG